MATAVNIPLNERSISHLSSFTTLVNDKLHKVLRNPGIYSLGRFVDLYQSIGVTFATISEAEAVHAIYSAKMQNYIAHTKTLSPSQFAENIKKEINLYVDCFSSLPTEIEAKLREGLLKKGVSLQIQLGVNPDSPSDTVWAYETEIYDIDDFEPVLPPGGNPPVQVEVFGGIQNIRFSGEHYVPLMKLKPGATPTIETIIIDRRLSLLAENPYHVFQRDDSYYQDEKEFLEQYRIYCIGRKKQSIAILNRDLQRLARKQLGIEIGNIIPDNWKFPDSCPPVYYNREDFTVAEWDNGNMLSLEDIWNDDLKVFKDAYVAPNINVFLYYTSNYNVPIPNWFVDAGFSNYHYIGGTASIPEWAIFS
ncbi:MAG: hypothetical protein ACTSRK_13995 [Promethearchaeota archaeon]